MVQTTIKLEFERRLRVDDDDDDDDDFQPHFHAKIEFLKSNNPTECYKRDFFLEVIDLLFVFNPHA